MKEVEGEEGRKRRKKKRKRNSMGLTKQNLQPLRVPDSCSSLRAFDLIMALRAAARLEHCLVAIGGSTGACSGAKSRREEDRRKRRARKKKKNNRANGREGEEFFLSFSLSLIHPHLAFRSYRRVDLQGRQCRAALGLDDDGWHLGEGEKRRRERRIRLKKKKRREK